MTSTRLVDQGDSLWLVWREGKRAQLYPCAVDSIVRSSPEATVVRLSFLQDNGVYQEPSEIALRSSARFDEGAMRSPNRAHMDWGYRTTSVGESDFKPSAHMASSSRGRSNGPVKRRGDPVPEETLERLQRVEERLSTMEKALVDVRGDMAALRGTLDSWDRTVDRMAEYQRSHAMLQEEVRRLKRSQGNPRIDEDPTEAAAGPDLPASTSASDPMCCGCKKYLAYDAPMSVFLRGLTGDDKMDLGDLFTLPGGRVKANSKAKKHVRCAECMPAGALRLIVYTSGGGGGRRQCDWCRATYSNQMTDSASGWCGSKHSSCRSLVIENETNRQGNSQFLAKGVAAVKEVVPWDEVKLIDVGLKEQWNDADYVIVATSSLGKALVILEVDNRQHAGGGIYSPAAEKQKNDGNFQAGASFDKVLFLRVNPSGQYTVGDGQANLDKRARWLIVRDWIVTFLRYPLGAWAHQDKALVYLFYSGDSGLIDVRPSEFETVVAYKAPALPSPAPPDLADWACCLDPYLLVKGSALAQEHLALKDRHAIRAS